MQYTSDKLKRDRSSTDWNAECKKAIALVRVLSYIIEHEEFNPGFVYVAKYINQKCIEYLSELGILEQPSTTRITEKLLNAFPNFCPKSINKNSVVLFSGMVSTLVKNYIELPDDFFIALRKIVLPVRKELFKQENTFFDELNLKCQKAPIPKKLLLLSKVLIDRFNHDKVNFSQESQTTA